MQNILTEDVKVETEEQVHNTNAGMVHQHYLFLFSALCSTQHVIILYIHDKEMLYS